MKERLLPVGAALALGGGAAAAAFAILVAVSVRRMTKRRRPDPPSDPGALGLPHQEVRFRTADGLTLGGWWIPAPVEAGNAPALIFCHGHAGSMEGDLDLAPAFHQAGFHVLMFDFRAHGRSEGQQVSMGPLERLDVQAAARFVQSRGVRRMGVLGFSMGGTAALLAAAECPLVQAVAVDGAFLHLEPALAASAQEQGLPGPLARALARITVAVALRLLRLPTPRPAAQVGRIAPRPLLLIHGGQDRYVPLRDALTLYARAGSPKQLWLVGEAEHRRVHRCRPEAYAARLAGFFWQALADPTPPAA
ncbi:MAG: alpha/beta hydrolase [Chloroflexi bacterium]|nr:alpha/beta hydrolase [Chloroflexota bacterium]